MDKIRDAIRERIDELEISDSEVSRQLGKHRGYIHEFLSGKQATLPFDIKRKLVEVLAMPPHILGVSNATPDSLAIHAAGGLHEDAEPYNVPTGSILTSDPAIGYFRMRTDCLANHPLRIQPGDVLAFSMTQRAIEAVTSEQIVLLQCYDRRELLQARTLVREFMRPSLVMTNRESDNEIFNLDDRSLDFEPHIKGVLVNVVRGA